jgi:CheY-like chemotaxis protein
MTRPRILCVDDEPHVLAGMQLNLRRDFDVLIATSGELALGLLEVHPDVSVIVCDMRMPKMNGAALLAAVRARFPDVTRVLLTGQADMSAAISAINDGQIFRFLTKPCDRDALLTALRDAVQHYQLIHAERVLLQETLRGAVEALVDLLALAAPLTFGRANRVKQRARQLAEHLELSDAWQLEMAVSLQHLGYMALSHSTLEKLYAGHDLDEDAQKELARMPTVTEQILSHIPRLEPIRAILEAATRQSNWSGFAGEGSVELAGAILRLANEVDAIETTGVGGMHVVKLLRTRGGHPAQLLDALQVLVAQSTSNYIVELPLAALRGGMVVADDLFLNGALLVARGYVVTASFLERARHFAKGAVKEPIRILMTERDGADAPRFKAAK